MAALMGNHHFEREILRVGIALKCLGIDSQEIRFLRAAEAKLGSASLTVNMAIFNTPDKSKLSGNVSRSAATGTLLVGSQRSRLASRHQHIVPTRLRFLWAYEPSTALFGRPPLAKQAADLFPLLFAKDTLSEP